MPDQDPASEQQAIAAFQTRNGVLRTTEALAAGVHPRTLYAMRDAGRIEPLARGLWRLTGLPPLAAPDLVTVALQVPRSIICLVSALSFHDLTTQVPHAVDIALPSAAQVPRLAYPPVRVFWYGPACYTAGVERPVVDGMELRVYSPEKTLVDCFRYRRKLGLDIAIEALRLYRERRRARPNELLQHARACRVERVMRPYLEAVL